MPSPHLNQISWKSKILWLHIHMFDGDLMYNQPSGSIYPLKSSLLCHVAILFWFYLTKQFHLWVEPRFLKAFNPHLFLISQRSYDKQPHFHVHPSWLKWLITMSSFTYVYPFINSIKPNCMCIQSVHMYIYICVCVCGLLTTYQPKCTVFLTSICCCFTAIFLSSHGSLHHVAGIDTPWWQGWSFNTYPKHPFPSSCYEYYAPNVAPFLLMKDDSIPNFVGCISIFVG